MFEDVVQTGLVAGNTGVDALGLAEARLAGKVRVGQQRAGHGHQVGLAGCQQRLGHRRIVDAVRGHHRNRHHGFDALHRVGPTGPRHVVRDGGHIRLMPANAGVQNIGPGGFSAAGQFQRFVPRHATFDQIECRDAVDDGKVWPHGLAHRLDNLDGETDAAFKTATKLVSALVGAGRGELVDQVTLRAHDFHRMVANIPCSPCCICVGCYGFQYFLSA